MLPKYAELQRGEAAQAHEHLAHGVPDLRVATLPARYEDLLRRELPLESDEIERLRAFSPRFSELCDELAARGVPETVQHDDLHMANVYAQGEQLRVLDWGDASISHPFASLVRHVPVPRGDQQAAAGRPVVRSAARRVPRAVGERARRHVRARAARRRVRAHRRVGASA